MRDVQMAALAGKVDDRLVRTYCNTNREVRRDIQAGQKSGLDEQILDAPPEDDKARQIQELEKIERELEVQREAIRKKREELEGK